MGRDLQTGVVVHGLASPQPPPDGGSVLDRGFGELLAEGDALRASAFEVCARGRCSFGMHLLVVRWYPCFCLHRAPGQTALF
jgi:hypothetical protein